MKLMDLTSRLFGRLTVLSRADNNKQGNTRWLCRCTCGVEKVVRSSDLQRGDSKSCGCLRAPFKDLTGQVFGRWIALSCEGSGQRGYSRWLCRCDCGVEKVVRSSDLHGQKGSKSCGCLKIDSARRGTLPGEAGFNSYFNNVKRNAKQRGITFELDKEYVRALCQKPCYQCGTELSMTTGKGHAAFRHNGIDRLDSDLGYVVGNCVACCDICNEMKMDRTLQEHLAKVEKIYKYAIVDRKMNNKLIAQLRTEIAGRV